MSAQRDFVRQFRPTADQEWANRRHSEQPATMAHSAMVVCVTFIAGVLLGATIVLMGVMG